MVTKWSLYTSLLTYASTWVLTLFTVDITFTWFIQSLMGFISGAYVLITELDLESLKNLKFSLINDYNKLLAKVITKLEAVPNKTEDIIKRITKLKKLIFNIPEDKIVHEVKAIIPADFVEDVRDDLNNKLKEGTVVDYYLEQEKLMDPEYRKQKFKEYLKENADRQHKGPKLIHVNSNLDEGNIFTDHKKLWFAVAVFSIALIANAFWPAEFHEVE